MNNDSGPHNLLDNSVDGILRILGIEGILIEAPKFGVKGPGRIVGISGIFGIMIQVNTFS